MAVRTLPRYPPIARDEDPTGTLAGVGFWGPPDLDGDVVLAVSETKTRGPLLVAGLTSFMFVCATVTGATVQMLYDHLDPTDGSTVVFSRIIGNLVVSGVATLQTFGAFAAVGASESFVLVNLKFTNTSGAVGASVTGLRLWGSAR